MKSRRSIFVVFAVLCALTLAEIGVIYVPGIARAPLITALVLMALGKAGLVLMFFMHLADENDGLKLAVLAPFSLPALYAFALICDATWRFAR